jgi:hypothetical protein
MSANMSETSGTADAPSATPNDGRRSKVLENFEQDLVIVGDVPKAVCKYCAMKLTCSRKSGTSSLLSHISESCRSIGDEVRAMFLATLKKKIQKLVLSLTVKKANFTSVSAYAVVYP